MFFSHSRLNNLPGRPAPPHLRASHTRGGADGFLESLVAERLALRDRAADVGERLCVELAVEERAVGGLATDVVPPQGEIQRMRRDEPVRLAEGVAAVAGPAVLAGVGDHVGAHGVEFDVALAGEKIVLGLDGTGLVAAFPEGAAALVVAVDVLDVAPAERLHEAGGPVGGAGRDEQMDVVGHEDVGVDDAAPVGSRFLEPVEVAVIVLLGEEAGLAIDASLDEVLRNSGKLDARAAGHGLILKS